MIFDRLHSVHRSFLPVSGWARSKRGGADGAVARTKLIRLQAVENPQDLVRIAADVQIVDGYVLNHIVGIDDECRAECDAFVRITHAELVDKRARHIGELPVIEAMEIAVITPPAELG